MMQKMNVIDDSGNILRTITSDEKPETWARFLLISEWLQVGEKVYGRLSYLGKQYYAKKTKGIPLSPTRTA